MENSIFSTVHVMRGEPVILDSDLARLYGTQTKVLNQAVKRNMERFPEEFMFQLTNEEFSLLRSVIPEELEITNLEVTNCDLKISNADYGGRRIIPYAFTEYGAVMASTVLNSEQAIKMSLHVVRGFVQMRHELSQKLVIHPEILRLLDPPRSGQAGILQQMLLRSLGIPYPDTEKCKTAMVGHIVKAEAIPAEVTFAAMLSAFKTGKLTKECFLIKVHLNGDQILEVEPEELIAVLKQENPKWGEMDRSSFRLGLRASNEFIPGKFNSRFNGEVKTVWQFLVKPDSDPSLLQLCELVKSSENLSHEGN